MGSMQRIGILLSENIYDVVSRVHLETFVC